MTLIKRFNSEWPDYLEGFFGKDSTDNFWYQRTGTTTPAVNILESANEFFIELAAPGFNKADFNINLHNNILTISLKKEEGKSDLNRRFTKREFNYGGFERVFTLPNSIEGDKIEAQYFNGILKISIPKKEEAKVKTPKAIEIK